MIVDVLPTAQMKRWLLECYRVIDWNRMEEVGPVFTEIDLVLKGMAFHQHEDGQLELSFYANRITTPEALYAGLARLCRRHGAEFVDARIKVEHNVRQMEWGRDIIRYQGPSDIEVIAFVLPPGSRRRRGLFGQVMAAHRTRAAIRYGYGHAGDAF